jgi:hypothetical protein
LFATASQTLLQLGRDPRWLGAQLGITAVLHTWTRDLRLHCHLHCIVTGGGLSSDGRRWVPTSPDFLFPVHVASALFRGKFLAALRESVAQGRLVVPEPQGLAQLCDTLHRTSWVVYSKPPFGGADHVFR